MSTPDPFVDEQDNYVLAGDVALQLVIDIANKAKDQADTELDAKRMHGGQTLDEFLARRE